MPFLSSNKTGYANLINKYDRLLLLVDLKTSQQNNSTLNYPELDNAKLLSSPYITNEEFEYLVANLTKYLGLVSKLKNRSLFCTEPKKVRQYNFITFFSRF